MKKEELRYDPVHDKIAAIIDYIDSNKNIAIQGLLVIALAVGWWGYYSGLEKDRVNASKSLVGVAQNAYNAGQGDLSLSELKDIVEEYSGTDAANQALVYLLKNAYQANNDESVLSLANEHGSANSDGVLDAGFYEALGNAEMNMNDVDAAINNFKKADKLASMGLGDSRYKIDLAIALISKEDFPEAILVLGEILCNENVNYSDKNRAEELLAVANFNKDN
jgi:outer membrane protein assembly factor BamD (BamD/ComL family)